MVPWDTGRNPLKTLTTAQGNTTSWVEAVPFALTTYSVVKYGYRIVKEGNWMKKAILVLLIAGALLIATTSAAFAGGDQVRGENGQGAVVQVQVQDPPPFR